MPSNFDCVHIELNTLRLDIAKTLILQYFTEHDISLKLTIAHTVKFLIKSGKPHFKNILLSEIKHQLVLIFLCPIPSSSDLYYFSTFLSLRCLSNFTTLTNSFNLGIVTSHSWGQFKFVLVSNHTMFAGSFYTLV